MNTPRTFRHLLIASILLLGVWWAFASAGQEQAADYPNAHFLVTGVELMERLEQEPIVVIDVRDDEFFDGKMIPGAIRLPWTMFRSDSRAANMGGLFVGTEQAQDILGRHGVFRNDTIILYDSVARDGGATASYVFWVLDLLGHEKKALLERGIDGWLDAGGPVVNEPARREPLLYQAPGSEIDLRRLADENFILPRLGDPYYQILDVRSAEEYSGENLNTGLDGAPLKAGHIPGAYNINYQENWRDPETKALKSYDELIELYRGITAGQAVITYCHSARRGSFSYFILRLMGFNDVILYENSWFGWGSPEHYYPVETSPRTPGREPSAVEKAAAGKPPAAKMPTGSSSPEKAPSGEKPATQDKGYISCGG